jgi:FkbM family methyltransferase
MKELLSLSRSKASVNVVVVGCNKGDDFVAQLGSWSGNASYDVIEYTNLLRRNYHNPIFPCGSAKPMKAASALVNGVRPVRGYCLEPMGANYRLLRNLTTTMRFDETAVHVIHAAADMYPGTADFPDSATPGIEDFRLGMGRNDLPSMTINVTNLDTFFAAERLDVIDFLSIDTEGK